MPFRSEALETALKDQDAVAVAFALRNERVGVPLLEGDQVRVFRRDDADRYMLLVFSSMDAYQAMLPEEPDLQLAAYDGDALREFLAQNIGVLEALWFDVAGPHAMQAAPQDVLDALELSAGA